MAYDAWCLLENGTDRWLHSWPVYLNNTGNGQSVLYCILCALSFRLFGVSTLAIRLPAAAFSLLTLFYGIKLVHLCWGNDRKRIALVTLLFVLVPYFTQNSRYGLDCNLMLGASTVFLYYFFKAIQSGEIRWYLISGFWRGDCALLLYYFLSYRAILSTVFCYLFAVGQKSELVPDIRLRGAIFISGISAIAGSNGQHFWVGRYQDWYFYSKQAVKLQSV